jgi:hypothetical protein
MSDEQKATWRVVLDAGSVANVEITRKPHEQWQARFFRASGGEHGIMPRAAVLRLMLRVGWEPREILAPGESTRAEALAAERERCARLCDEVAEAASAALGSEHVAYLKGRRRGAELCAEKIRAGGA